MFLKRPTLTIFCVIAGLVLWSSHCSAQTTVEGIILDPAGAAIPHVPLKLEASDRHAASQESASDGEGKFRFTGVAAGRYTLAIAPANGFAAYNSEIDITRKLLPPLKVQLALESIQQQANVDAAQDGVTTDPGQNRDQIATTGQMLGQLPILDQNYIASLTPFLDQAGMATSGVSIIVDGVEMKGTGVSASAIQEVRINNDPYSAETNLPGKGRIEIMTKPGTPQFHGTFNFGFRDSLFDAKNYFALSRPSEQKRIYEGSITGPIARDKKMTFLVSGTRQEDDLQAIVHAFGPSGLIAENVPTPSRDTELAFRITRDFTDNHRASLQYNVTDLITRNQGVGGLVEAQSGVNAQAREDDIVFNDRLILSPALINQLQILLEKDHNPTRSVLDATKIVVDGSSTTGGAQADLLTTENNMKFNDTVNWSRGRHYIKFGLNIPNVSRRAWEDDSNQRGTFNFSSLADLSAQQPYSFTQQQGPGRVVFWWVEVGAFVQDQIRITPNLQVSLGLRYDWQTHFPSSHDLAPRVSLAYSLADKTVLRMGAGLFYDRSGATPIADLARYNGIILRSYTVLDPGYPNPLPPGEPSSALPTNLVQLAASLHMPYTTHYSFGVDHQLNKQSSLAITYRGSLGVDLFRSRDSNAPLPPDYLLPPNPDLGVVRQIEFAGRQVQNALDITLQGKLNRWFSGLVQYTWSHTDNNTGGISWFPANQYDLTGEYSRADFDQNHRFNLLGTVNEGHWLSLGIGTNLYSGSPYTETSGTDTFKTGILNARPAGVARNTLQSAGYADLDVRWSHDFYFNSHKEDSDPHVSIAADGFNLPNHTNYTSYIGNVQSAFFGMPTAALPARRFQFTARLSF
jgi:hypothetical protein